MTIDDMAMAMQDADGVPQRNLQRSFERYRRLARAAAQSMCGEWITVHAEAAHYVSDGKTKVLCDRLPRPCTLVIKLAADASAIEARRAATEGAVEDESAVPQADAKQEG